MPPTAASVVSSLCTITGPGSTVPITAASMMSSLCIVTGPRTTAPAAAASVVSSLDNCAYYCGFCGEFVVHCYWAKDKCAYYCGFCGEFVGQLCLLLRLLR